MSRSASLLVAALLALLPLQSPSAQQVASKSTTKLNLGRIALPEEIAAWDTDVRADGKGLPPGKGTVKQGDEIFQAQCAACHGEFGQGVGRWPVLAGGQDHRLVLARSVHRVRLHQACDALWKRAVAVRRRNLCSDGLPSQHE